MEYYFYSGTFVGGANGIMVILKSMTGESSIILWSRK
jgi:hypothetical protein